MPSGGENSSPRPDSPVDETQPVRILKAVTSVSVAFLITALLAVLFAPKDAGTMTLYGLVIGLNLLIILAFWPAVKWLQRLSR
jgi:hypothetical protein